MLKYLFDLKEDQIWTKFIKVSGYRFHMDTDFNGPDFLPDLIFNFIAHLMDIPELHILLHFEMNIGKPVPS